MRESFTDAVHADINAFFENGIRNLLQVEILKAAFYQEGGFLAVCGALFTQDERAFLARMAATFKRVELGFTFFSLMRSTLRPLEALALTDKQPRVGWDRIGVPSGFIQSVGEHQRSGGIMARLLYADHPQCPLIEQVFRYHDCGEAVIGDFTPHCPIAKSEKAQLEALAVRLLTFSAANNGHPIAVTMRDCFNIFEGVTPGYDDVRDKARIIDALEMAMEARLLRQECPPEERAALEAGLKEFDTYIGPKMTCPRGAAFFHALQMEPEGLSMLQVKARAMEAVWKADKAYAVFCGPSVPLMNQLAL